MTEKLFTGTLNHNQNKKQKIKCFSGLHFTKLIGKPLIMSFSTSGKKMGYKCIDFPMLDNIISIYGIKTG